jgi:hypothetical protein
MNLRQGIWLELIKDYDLGINYHPGKVNVVVDALSRKKYCNAIDHQCEIYSDHKSLKYILT